MKVVLTMVARDDLRAIAFFIADDNPARARSFVRELKDVASRIGNMPRPFPLVPRFEALGIRRRSYRGYAILYAVQGDRVIVHRVLGPGQDHDRLLGLE